MASFLLRVCVMKIRAKRSQFGDGRLASRGQSCKTNPICAGPGEDQGSCDVREEEVGRGRPTYEETPEGRGPLCETNPISRGRAGRAEGRRGRSGRRRWVKACETKPIPPERSEGASAVRKKSYDELELPRASEKQSQFAEECQVSSFKFEVGEPGVESCESSDFELHTPNSRRAAGGTGCTNKANLPTRTGPNGWIVLEILRGIW
jgi:hypothetical protein